MKRQSGQITVEAVLVLTILLSTSFAGLQVFKNRGYLSKLVEGPWQYLAGMIENGMWSPPKQGRAKHPNHVTRHGSPTGDAP